MSENNHKSGLDRLGKSNKGKPVLLNLANKSIGIDWASEGAERSVKIKNGVITLVNPSELKDLKCSESM